MYDYEALLNDIKNITSKNAEIFSIGKSTMKKDIFCIKTGTGKKCILLNGAHHGLEYITSAFLMRFIKEYLYCSDNKKQINDIYPHKLSDEITLFAVPMVNPDGVDIAVNGLDITNPYHRRLISNVGIHSFNKVWQANVNGVDLNHNYQKNKLITVDRPAPTKYAGAAPLDQPESRALAQFISKIKCDMLLCFHSQGREIYYDYDGKCGENAEDIARKMQNVSGYTPSQPSYTAQNGGCKDWFIDKFGKNGFTIEIGSGKNPLPQKYLNNIYDENSKIITVAINEIISSSL